MARIYDNINSSFDAGLRATLSSLGVVRADFCVGYFNLRGWDCVASVIDKLPGAEVAEGEHRDKPVHRVCRLLVGMVRPPLELCRMMRSGFQPDREFLSAQRKELAEEFARQIIAIYPTAHDEQTLHTLLAQLKAGKVCVKLYVREPLHAKLYLTYSPANYSCPSIGIMGSSNLTFSGLTGNGELNAEFSDTDQAAKLADWFEGRWNDRFCTDITKELIDCLENSWASGKLWSPYLIYLKTVWHLCLDARRGIAAGSLPEPFSKLLLNFQQEAVKIVARRLETGLHGAIVGDVVGLGKTITACAVCAIHERDNGTSTLIVCPASLQQMWREHVARYDLKADVVSMSAKNINPTDKHYGLIIIDESHNLRSGTGKRYAGISALVEKQACHVLLLSATIYNKSLDDIYHQLAIFIPTDADLGMRPERHIAKNGGPKAFAQKHPDTLPTSLAAFRHSDIADDWNDILRLLLVRRTRSFIARYYAKEDPQTGRRFLTMPDGTRNYFPIRKPVSQKFEPDEQYKRLYSAEMQTLIESLSLPRYGLAKYLDSGSTAAATSEEKDVIDSLSRAGERMRGFCKSTFFKRIDSSGYAFLLTAARHIERNILYVHCIDNDLPLPVADNNTLLDDFDDDEGDTSTLNISTDLNDYRRIAAQYYSDIRDKDNVRWLSPRYFKDDLREKLLGDCDIIIQMINLCGTWDATCDAKLECLRSLVADKHPKDKVVVFTQYADTAEYLYRQLKDRGVTGLGLATGSSDDPTAIAHSFSPVSNGINIAPGQQIRVLIATDVLSEGQNLQDAHIVANYDLPWAIIRLIQRAGRVDRIGQKADTIECHSFYPAKGLEDIIKLRSRLLARLNENANVIGSDERFFDDQAEGGITDLFTEKAGILDGDEDDVDLPSKAYQIWREATMADPTLLTTIPAIPDVVASAKAASEGQAKGVITYAKTAADNDILQWTDTEGNIISQSQARILDALACPADTPAQPLATYHHQCVEKTMADIEAQGARGTIGGITGNARSTRARTLRHLEDAINNRKTDLFYNGEQRRQTEQAYNQLYQRQLLPEAKRQLDIVLRTEPAKTADTATDLYLADALCRKADTTGEQPKIICSLGLN